MMKVVQIQLTDKDYAAAVRYAEKNGLGEIEDGLSKLVKIALQRWRANMEINAATEKENGQLLNTVATQLAQIEALKGLLLDELWAKAYAAATATAAAEVSGKTQRISADLDDDIPF